MGNVFQQNHTPATSENHWAYAVSGQGHCKTSANNRIKIEQTRVEINWAQSTRCNHN